MKRTVGVVIMVLVLAVCGHSLGLSLKIKGGASYAAVGDYNSGIDGANAFFADQYANVSGGLSKLGLGMDFGAELLLDVTRNLGLGLGFGYLRFSTSSHAVEYDWTYLSWPFHSRETQGVMVSAMPITLNIHYRLPLAGFIFRIFAGAGYYLGRMEFERTYGSDFLDIGEKVSFRANKNRFGFQGGVGLEWPLGSGLSAILDVTGRLISFPEFQGYEEFTPTIFGLEQPARTGDDAYFWYFEQIVSGTIYPRVDAGWSEPAGSHPRHGRFDLSGISGQVGVKFAF